MARLSTWLTSHRRVRGSSAVLARVSLAMARLPNVLEVQVVAHQKTLEQKISDQGPPGKKVDPDLLGLAIRELATERKIIKEIIHKPTNTRWYANARTSSDKIEAELEVLAPLYHHIATGDFPNHVGDALEIVTQSAIAGLARKSPRISFNGSFDLAAPRNKEGRVPKTDPPTSISGHHSRSVADFHIHGLQPGPYCVECKNLRDWIYPGHELLRDVIRRSIELNAFPLLVARRVHYSTISNFLAPVGVIVHETYNQYYPSYSEALAEQVRHKRTLGFSDVVSSASPSPRTLRFFSSELPRVAASAAKLFEKHLPILEKYASKQVTLSDVYAATRGPGLPPPDDPWDIL